jgi:hypothetical protein
MPTLKCEVYPLPELVNRNGRLWFKLKLDSKQKWQPDTWHEPVADTLIQSIVQDTTLITVKQQISRLMELSGRDYMACYSAIHQNKWSTKDNTYFAVSEADFERHTTVPIQCSKHFWMYRNRLVKVLNDDVPTDELTLLIKHKVLSNEKALDRVRREVDAFENFSKLDRTSREPIPEHVRMFVWQRDEGRCVKCGSRERLEYDHIIAVANGGSTTERNIQLLCESCNRSKGANI